MKPNTNQKRADDWVHFTALYTTQKQIPDLLSVRAHFANTIKKYYFEVYNIIKNVLMTQCISRFVHYLQNKSPILLSVSAPLANTIKSTILSIPLSNINLIILYIYITNRRRKSAYIYMVCAETYTS